MDDLPFLISNAYDLSVTKAAELSIPIVGSVSGGHNRRVLILERSAYKPIESGNITKNYGYAIRLVITVNKWNAGTKISLPFIAASAELSNVEAKWLIQVIGLAGKAIDDVTVPPTDLNVETFVLAKQSLVKLIKAVRGSDTKFIPQVISTKRPKKAIQLDYKIAIAKTVALNGIKSGWSLEKTIKEYDQDQQEINDTISDIYRNFAMLEGDQEKPNKQIKRKATLLLEGLDIKIL